MLPDEIINPLDLMRRDRALARERHDSLAEVGCLATADASGQPHARFITLREIDGSSVTFWASGTSPKLLQLKANGNYELTTYWPTLARQYRLQGSYEWIAAAVAQAEHAARPGRAKLWDWLHEELPQSTPVADRSSLVAKFENLSAGLTRSFGDLDAVAPAPSAGFIRLEPRRVEVQELDLDRRLHDRRVLIRDGDRWTQSLLVP